MSDTSSQASPAAVAASPTGLALIWQDVQSFFQAGEQFAMKFLADVANGAQILVSDIESVAQYVEGHAGLLTATVDAVATAATSIAPGNTTVQQVVADLQKGVSDAASLASAIRSGNTAGADGIVTTAVTAINAVKTVQQTAAQASAALASLAAGSPSATSTTSAPSPSSGA